VLDSRLRHDTLSTSSPAGPWKAGCDDAIGKLSHPEVLQRPDKLEGVRTFDFTQAR
jgi:hypothetical protein